MAHAGTPQPVRAGATNYGRGVGGDW